MGAPTAGMLPSSCGSVVRTTSGSGRHEPAILFGTPVHDQEHWLFEEAAPFPFPPSVSVIVPVFGDGGDLDDLVGRVAGVLGTRDAAWELILVNDGSPATTWQV